MAPEVSVSSIIEAMLFVGGEPLAVERIQRVLRGVEPAQIAEAAAGLSQLYHQQNRPYTIRRVGSAYQMLLRPRYASLVRRLTAHSRVVRLSQAALQVLSIVAYRQPVSLQEIESTRGVDSMAPLRLLRRRSLVEVTEQATDKSRAPLYSITKRFLQVFQLDSLDDLPRVLETDRHLPN